MSRGLHVQSFDLDVTVVSWIFSESVGQGHWRALTFGHFSGDHTSRFQCYYVVRSDSNSSGVIIGVAIEA